jgi:hypothetical protein
MNYIIFFWLIRGNLKTESLFLKKFYLGGIALKLKKLGVSMALAGISLAIPFTSAFAASGWQKLGTFTESKVFNSGGGYVKVCAHVPVGLVEFTLYEYDPDNADDYVTTTYLGDGSCETIYVDKFVDGGNNKAELYYKSSSDGTSVTVYD